MTTNSLLVIDANRTPLKPTQAVRARILQSKGKAKLLRQWGVLILGSEASNPPALYLDLRIDPGSKVTGFALVDPATNTTVWGMNLAHRGLEISSDLTQRAGCRRGRRSRNTRYRQKRFNRRKLKGWLAPSLMHRVLTVETWIKRICKFAPVASISIERVKFDMQKLENPDIQGVEYCQGRLAGYTLREALLEHWGRECAYCGAKNTPLEVEHIVPRSKGGSNRFSNLTLACECCNKTKDDRPVEEFLADKPDVLKRIKAHSKASLRDAATVNSTRTAIVKMAEQTGLPVKRGDGASTKMIRILSGLPKDHWVDAACVATDRAVKLGITQPLQVTCKGHGNRQAVRVNDSGFPVISIKVDENGKKQVKVIAPKKTYTHATAGDVVQVKIGKRKHLAAGAYTARVKTPTPKGVEVVIQGHRVSVSMQYVKFKHRNDGYSYGF